MATMNLTKEKVARAWVSAAHLDLTVAKDLQRRLPPVACFHAQQSAEKSLKAVLIMLTGEVPRTDVILDLLAAIHEFDLALPLEIRSEAVTLDEYYLATRYPDASGVDPMHGFSAAQSAHATQLAESLYLWVNITYRLY